MLASTPTPTPTRPPTSTLALIVVLLTIIVIVVTCMVDDVRTIRIIAYYMAISTTTLILLKLSK